MAKAKQHTTLCASRITFSIDYYMAQYIPHGKGVMDMGVLSNYAIKARETQHKNIHFIVTLRHENNQHPYWPKDCHFHIHYCSSSQIYILFPDSNQSIPHCF